MLHKSYVLRSGALRESLARRLFYELISGINHLHLHNIVHRTMDHRLSYTLYM